MKILFCGDVVGKSGRVALTQALPLIRNKISPDIIIVNGENAAHGFGLTPKLFQGFFLRVLMLSHWGIILLTKPTSIRFWNRQTT